MGHTFFKCTDSECFYHSTAMPFPDDLPVIPKCPLCGAEMAPEVKKHWLAAAAEDRELWADDAVELYPSVLAYEYRQLRKYCAEQKSYAVLMNLKDNFEALLKLETLLAFAWSRDRLDDAFEQTTLALLTSPNLSMGAWLELANTLLKNLKARNQSLPEEQRNTLPELIPLEKIRKFYAKNEIVNWRNAKIGHGSMQLEEDQEFQEDILEKLRLLKALFLEIGDQLKEQKLFCGEFLLTGADRARNLGCDGKIEFHAGDVAFSCDPFIVIRKHETRGSGVYFFDNQKAATLTFLQAYAEGTHSSEEVGYFSRLRSLLEKGNLHLEELTDSKYLTEGESRELDRLQMSHRFVDPKHLTGWLTDCVNKHKKGVFLLCMERGMGKSVFSEQLNRLNNSPLGIAADDADPDVRTYHFSRTQTTLSGDFENQTEWMWGQSYKHETDWTRVPRIRDLREQSNDSAQALCDFLEEARRYSSGKRGRNHILMVLDGLDEIINENIWEYIPTADRLTEGVYILLTSRDPETEVLPRQFAEKLAKLQVQETLQVKSDSEDNDRFLNEYLNTTKLRSLDTAHRAELLSRAEHRVLQLGLYCRLLEGGMPWESLPDTDHVAAEYLKMLEDRMGEKESIFAREILAVLCTLGSLEPLKIRDLGGMTAENGVTLRLAGLLRDLAPFLKTERSAEGNKYTIINSDLAEKLAKQIPETMETVRQQVRDTMAVLKEGILKDGTPHDGILQTAMPAEPLAAHVTELSRVWLPEKTEAMGADAEDVLKAFAAGREKEMKLLHERERFCDYERQLYLLLKERKGAEHLDTLEGLRNMITAMHSLGRFEEALPLIREAYETQLRLYGPEHPDTLESRRILAVILFELGRYEQALALQRENYEAGERVLGTDDLQTLYYQSDLARTLFRTGNYEESLTLSREALEISSRLSGKEDLFTLSVQHNLSDCLSALGKYGEALQLKQEEYEISRRILGPEHPVTLTAAGTLAAACHELGRYQESLQLNQEVYEADRKVLGEEHPETIRAKGNLALDLHELGRYSESLKLNQEVFETRLRVYGPEHPYTLITKSNMAYDLAELKRYDEALQLNREVYEARKRVLGPEHPDTLISLNNLASALLRDGKPGEALPLLKNAYELRKRVLGAEHPDTLSSLSNLAGLLSDMGKEREALKLRRNVCETSRRVLGEAHPDTLRAQNNLAFELFAMKQYREAIPLQQKTFHACRHVLGADDPLTLLTQENLAVMSSDQGDHKTAVSLQRELCRTRKRLLGANHESTLAAQAALGKYLLQAKDIAEALSVTREAYETSLRILGKVHPVTQDASERLKLLEMLSMFSPGS